MKKSLILLFVYLLGFLCAFSIANAEWGNKRIEVLYRDITIYVNNKKISSDVEPFIYNGRTMVPLRFIAEALDKDVLWDGNKYRVYINDKNLTTNTPLQFEIIKKEFSSLNNTLEIQVKITNVSGRKINSAEVACILYDKDGKEIDFESNYVISSLEGGLNANDYKLFKYIFIDVDKEKVDSIGFKIVSINY